MTRVNVQFDISPSTFIKEAVQNMNSANSESACSILSELAKNHFLHRLDNLVEEGHALRYQQVGGIGQHSIYPHSLRQACSAPMSIGHFEVTLCQKRKGVPPKLVPVLPDNLHVERNSDFFEADDEWWIEAVSYLAGYRQPYRTRVARTKYLKTIVKTRFQLACYHIPTSITEQVVARFPSPCPCGQEYLMPYTSGVWHWIVHFICRICGKVYYCSCFREAFQKLPKSRSRSNLYYKDEEIPDFEDDSLFRDGLCHLCRQAPSDLHYCSSMYGNSLEVRYGPYIVKTGLVMDKGDPEDEVRLRLGIPAGLRWMSEFELYAIVKEILSDHTVKYQARPDWLGKQSLDIYIPSLKLAIEYQGRQHFEPVEYFGGEEGFRNTRMRDEKKADLCRENGVTLLYFKYTDSIAKSLVKEKLTATLNAANP